MKRASGKNYRHCMSRSGKTKTKQTNVVKAEMLNMKLGITIGEKHVGLTKVTLRFGFCFIFFLAYA